MNPPRPNEPELDALLGAYALDALDGDERARVEDYIAANPTARAEVDEMRETAATLALTPGENIDMSAPPELWDRIATTIASEPRDELAARRARKRPNWSTALLVAAAAIVVVLAVNVVVLQRRANDNTTASAAFNRATHAHGAQQLSFAANGTKVAKAVVLPDGSGFLSNVAMTPLASDKTYQLWAVTGDPQHPTMISAGVIGANPRTIGFHVNGPVHGIAISVENAGGAVQPSQVYSSATLTT
jgi:anti-sigma-K factor RskA